MERLQASVSLIQSALSMSRVPEAAASEDALEIAALARRSAAGDSIAFGQIIQRYERRVLTLAIRFLGTIDDAQDAAQEVFLRAFRYIHRLDLQKPIEPWLVQMTVNVCRDLGRKRLRRRKTFPEMTEPEAAPSQESANPYTELADEQQRRMLWRALRRLPSKERLAVVLRDIEGLSTSEVAVVLRSSETTVRSQVSRARLKIKEDLDRMTGGRS